MRSSVRHFASAQRSPRTAKTYAAIVGAFLDFFGGHRPPTRHHVEQFLALPLKRSGARSSPATYNQALAALRAFAEFAVNQNIWATDPTDGLAFERAPEKDPAVLFVPEVQGFFRAIPRVSPSPEVARDRAILALLFTVGLRVSELARLDVSQIDLRTSTVLGVRRKGGRVQTLPLEPRTVHLLSDWFEQRSRDVSTEQALFLSRLGTRLSVRSIERLFERLRTYTGTPKRVTPHTARHSFITIELALGADITVVSRLAGHASISTTMRYRHLVEAEPRKAVGLLGVVIPSELVHAQTDLRVANTKPSGTTQDEVLKERLSSIAPANDTLDDQENLDDACSSG